MYARTSTPYISIKESTQSKKHNSTIATATKRKSNDENVDPLGSTGAPSIKIQKQSDTNEMDVNNNPAVVEVLSLESNTTRNVTMRDRTPCTDGVQLQNQTCSMLLEEAKNQASTESSNNTKRVDFKDHLKIANHLLKAAKPSNKDSFGGKAIDLPAQPGLLVHGFGYVPLPLNGNLFILVYLFRDTW